MSKRRKTGNGEETAEAEAAPSTEDPLRNWPELMEAARVQARLLLQEHRSGKEVAMTAMEFCRMVLDKGYGLQDWGVGQTQRIRISEARKNILGDEDGKIIKKPPKAPKLQLPCTRKIYKELKEDLSTTSSDVVLEKSIESELDADALKDKGIFLLPNIVPRKDVVGILDCLSKLEGKDKLKWTSLRPTTGNGQEGAYATLGNALPQSLENLQSELRQALKNKLGVKSGDKTIFLKYGVGGVNWSHQDQSTCPYQALLLLSRPGIDFQEGQLYVVDPFSDEKVCNKVDFQSSGDLVIFAANASNSASRPFYHGMSKVLPGRNKDEKDSHRLAIGLLQT